MMHPLRLLSATCLLTFTALASGGGSFTFIDGASSANDLSPNGRWVVGERVGGGTYRLDMQSGTLLPLPEPAVSAVAVSDDGSVVLGNIVIDGEEFAALWRETTGVWTSLGSLPGGLACPSRSSAYELSADGSVAVGLAWINGCSGVGFRWTEATGMVQLQQLANGSNRASVVNSAGTLIGGFAQGSFTRTPAIWTASGAGQLLDPTGDTIGEVYGMNDAGTILLGSANGKAVKWTGGGSTMSVLGIGSVLPGWSGIPMDIASNGTTVGFDILGQQRRAWLQVGGSGPLVDLKSYLEASGVPIDPLTNLQVCQAISLDGSTIIGHGGFFTNAWIVTLDVPVPSCPADVAPAGGDGVVNAADLSVLLGAWGTPAVDLDGDGVAGASDLAILLGAWGPCQGGPLTGACCFGKGCEALTEAECIAAGGSFLGATVPCSKTLCFNNDACADAIDITDFIDGPAIQGDNAFATPVLGNDPELPAGSPSCQWNATPEAAHSTVWYSFEANFLGVVTIQLCDSNPLTMNDSIMALYGGECGSLVEIACDEDGCGGSQFMSSLYAEGLVPGQRYYLCVMNAGAWSGSIPGKFSITITSP